MSDYPIIKEFLDKITPPIGLEEYLKAKHDWMQTNEWPTGEKLMTIILHGSYQGSVLRTTYLHKVWQEGIEARHYWNAVVKLFILGGLWVPAFEELLKTKEAKKLINKTTHPEWVSIGLLGCDFKKLKTKCEAFCRWFDNL